MAVPNTNTLVTATLRMLRRRIADNIFKANPVAAWFLMRGRVKTASGGRYISEPLLYITNPTIKPYRGYERLNVAPTEELTEAQYNWRLAAGSVAISGEEELQNAGPEQMFSMVKVKLMNLEKSFRQWFDEKLMAATSTKDTTRDILGLDEIIDDDGTWSTLGAIDSNTETWWRNQLGANGDGTGTMPWTGAIGAGTYASPIEITTTSSTQLTLVLNRMYHNCAKGSADLPDLILTDQAVYERYEQDSLDKLRLTDNALSDLGFENIKFKNTRMMWNENIKTGGDPYFFPIYFINSEYMSFTIHSRRNFVTSDFVSPWDQDARVAQMMFAGNTTCNNRRRLGVTWVDLKP